ncbi:hypothetical protein BHM03_00021529 [Ensete ventricosum]|uniref:Uncharacterized protein n=1 Tax=Ensete ventricosum TaxID=4639 RepID=A0A445MG94_ENSVE|nr:hypothetical protein BHM03_00021529 [Ensete ventricosum]
MLGDLRKNFRSSRHSSIQRKLCIQILIHFELKVPHLKVIGGDMILELVLNLAGVLELSTFFDGVAQLPASVFQLATKGLNMLLAFCYTFGGHVLSHSRLLLGLLRSCLGFFGMMEG